MPADDLVLNVRQIAQYTPVSSAPAVSSLLLQIGGIGGAYYSISPQALVSTALSTGGDLTINGSLGALSIQAGSVQFANAAVNLLSAQKACLVQMDAAYGTIAGVPIATELFASGLVAALRAATVWSFEGRTGPVCLWIQDILRAGGAPQFSPAFGGTPRAPTPPPWSHSSRLATTAFVHRNSVEYINELLKDQPFVFTFNGRAGHIVLTQQDILEAGGGADFDSPVFTGTPTAPTAAPGTNTTQLATTAFVQTAIAGSTLWAPLNSPTFTGYASAPTAPPGSSDGQLATTAFVTNAITESTTGVSSFNTRTGAVTLLGADITGAGGALLASPVFTGTPQAPTATVGDNSIRIATTAFVQAAVAGGTAGVTSFNTRTGAVTLTAADISGATGALLASPAFSGAPTAPTATPATNTTQLATTAFVQAAVVAGGGVQTFNGRTGAVVLNSNDISGAGGAALSSPAFTGTPTAPTAAPGTNTTQLATTAYVFAALSASGVTSFNTRTGAVTLTIGDVTAVGGAPLSSPAFSGVPTAPTAAAGNSSQQLATTEFVEIAIEGGAAVSSFNGRTGPVTLLGADITGAGGALLNSPIFIGAPTAPTAVSGTSTQQLATTAFVQAALGTGAVTSFNGRNGSVTLLSNDISGASGALLNSPVFTGTPQAPTAAPATNTAQIATTAFVQAVLGSLGGVTSFNSRAGAVTLLQADVTAALPSAATLPLMNGTAAAGSLTTWSRGDHVHPSDTSRLPLTGGTLSGGLTVNAAGGQLVASGSTAQIIVNKSASGGLATFNGTNNGLTRWAVIVGDITAESGANAGSNFAINSYNDAGANLGTPLQINRATSNAIFSGGLFAPYSIGFGTTGVGAINNIASCNMSIQGVVSEASTTCFWANRLGSNGDVHIFTQGGAANTCGSITVANGTSTSFNTTSDVRLKRDEQQFDAGPFLDQLKVYDFAWVSAPGVRAHGVMAQEATGVYPEAVFHDEQRDTWGVDYSKFVPLLLNEIKALRVRVAQLEASR